MSLLIETNKENESKLRKVVKENTRLSKSPEERHQIKVIREENRQLKVSLLLLLAVPIMFYQLQLSEMSELSKAKETELERVKEENAQLNSQPHHNVEKIHRAKLVTEEENERLKVTAVIHRYTPLLFYNRYICLNWLKGQKQMKLK